jgi:PPE-repeat protein
MPDFFARPPEVTTGMLQAGLGSGPMLAAAAAFSAQAAAFTAQSAVMTSALVQAASFWEGTAAISSATAAAKMPAWLAETAIHATERAARSTAQAAAYDAAYATTPQLPEIAQNHVTHAVLQSTNFLGINTVPIGINEADYGRMWGQAAGVMLSYMTETMTNLAALSPVLMPLPITIPGAGEAGLASSGFIALAGGPEAVGRDATLAMSAADSVLSSAQLAAGGVAATGNDIGRQTEQEAIAGAELADQSTSDGTQTAMGRQPLQEMQTLQALPQTVSEIGSQATQLPQQLSQGPTQALGQFTSPVQQFTQMFSQGGWGTDAAGAPLSQVGMFGVNPESNHPLAGGTGPAMGGGMYVGGGVPGSPGASARTPLLASLTTASAPAVKDVAVEPAVANEAAVRGGAAPVGMMPAGAHQKRSSTGTVEPLVAPGPLTFEDDFDVDVDDWG